MNVGFVAARLAGTDGVTLETRKLAEILVRRGHRVFYCAGTPFDSSQTGTVVPEMSFNHLSVRDTQARAFGHLESPGLDVRITAFAAGIKDQIREFIGKYSVDVLVTQNALTIPMHLPLGVALTDYIEETGFPTIAHHHDFWWERSRFAIHAVPGILQRCFPPDLPSIRHVVINSLARHALEARLNVQSAVLPNVLDFEHAPIEDQGRGSDLRDALGISRADRLILQPTRVVPRKGIEHSVDLVRRIQEREPDRRHVLMVSHQAGDEGGEYLAHLRKLAQEGQVEFLYLADWFPTIEKTQATGNEARWVLRDAYEASDFVFYPSLLEGFGNALLEAVYYRRPFLINRYPVYVADIEPCGFRAVSIDGAATDRAAAEVVELLADTSRTRLMVEHNYAVGLRHFSYRVADRVLAQVLADLRFQL